MENPQGKPRETQKYMATKKVFNTVECLEVKCSFTPRHKTMWISWIHELRTEEADGTY